MAEREIRYVHHRSTPIDILPDDAVEAIKDATEEVLWRTGIQVRSASLLMNWSLTDFSTSSREPAAHTSPLP